MQGGADALELGLDVPRPSRERLALGDIGPEQAERVAQQLAAVVFVGRAPRMHQGERVALA